MSQPVRHACLCALILAPWMLSTNALAAAAGVPVAVQTAAARDVPVYASGLGTVVALNSALIRARVDGTLQSVNFTEGQDVKAGDLLAIIDPRPYQAVLDQVVAKRDQDQAALANAQRDLARYSSLVRSGYATRQQTDTQGATVLGGQAQIDADQAAVAAAALNLSFTHVTAPISGRVGLRQINPGNLVHATDTQGLVVVTQLHPIGVLFTLPGDAVPEVADAQAHGNRPEVQALASDQSRLLATGTLLTIDNTINTATGTITLKVVFDNADDRLWPGQFVMARIRLRTLPHVIAIPDRAVQRGQDGLYVFVVGPDGRAVQRTVTEYQEQDGIAAIRGGLAVGERVVVDGQSRVSNGAALEITQARG